MSGRHLDAVQLAELAEGLLPDADADAASSHLADCLSCRRTAAALESVTATLRSVPATLPTPPAVVARLDTALAAETTMIGEAEPSGGPEGEHGSEADVVELGWFRRRAPQLLAAAATIGVLGLVGFVVGNTVFGGGTDMGAAEFATNDASDGAADMADEDASGEAEEAAPDEAETLSGQPEDDADDFDEPARESAATFSPLQAEILAVVDIVRAGEPTGLDAECGRALADELNLDLVGAAPTDLLEAGSILVVLDLGIESDPIVEGWVLPTCESGQDDALGEPELVLAG